MKYKLGIFGSAVDEANALEKGKELGREIANYKDSITLATGACSGMPFAVSSEAAKNGVEVWGFSSEPDEATQRKEYPTDDIAIYSKIFYGPQNYRKLFFCEEGVEFKPGRLALMKYRNVIYTAKVDAGIIISGRWGTLNEFTNLYDMGKIIGVYTGTGGVADELQNLMSKINKESKAKVVFNSNPKELVAEIYTLLQQQ